MRRFIALIVPTAQCLLTQYNKEMEPRLARSEHERFVLTSASVAQGEAFEIVIFDFPNLKHTVKYALCSPQLKRTAGVVAARYSPQYSLRCGCGLKRLESYF